MYKYLVEFGNIYDGPYETYLSNDFKKAKAECEAHKEEGGDQTYAFVTELNFETGEMIAVF